MRILFSFALFLVAVKSCHGANYAVLVAGSSGWGNYRHQADICHAYQVLMDRGFSKDNVITLLYDDIVNNQDNPMPGKIINQPNGPDVYDGVNIDYKGDDLTPANFLNILSGDEAAMKGIGTGRVLKSGSDDFVFINFADHGGVGILCFPSDNLYADDLEKTLRKMAQKKQFKKLLFYVEACEAGSMFDNILEEHNNILVSTASARDESSFGWYCDTTQLDTCMGDLYSISWMEHMDKILGTDQEKSETLWHQYDVVRTMVNESHVQLYGEFELGLDKIDTYFGTSTKTSNSFPQSTQETNVKFTDVTQGISSREVELFTAKAMLVHSPAHLKQARRHTVKEMMKNRDFAERLMGQLFKTMSSGKSKMLNLIMESKFSLTKENYPCYKNLVENFNRFCFNTAKNSYFLKFLNKFVNVCSLKWISEAEAIQSMKIVCHSKPEVVSKIV